MILARALLGTAGPVLAAEKSTDRIAALASYATWTDVGLAAGAFFGIVGVAEIGRRQQLRTAGDLAGCDRPLAIPASLNPR